MVTADFVSDYGITMSEKTRHYPNDFEGKSIDEFKPGDVITMIGPGQKENGNPDFSLVGKRLRLRAVANGVIYFDDLTPGVSGFGDKKERYYWLCSEHWAYYEEVMP